MQVNRVWILSAIFISALQTTPAGACVLVLDSGHDVAESNSHGAIGRCGQEEYKYNDLLTAVIAQKLRESSECQVILTREAGMDVKTDNELKSYLPGAARARWEKGEPRTRRLLARAAIANKAGCTAFVSIHHDSVIEPSQEGEPRCRLGPDGHTHGGKNITQAFRQRHTSKNEKFQVGYSLLIDQQNTAKSRNSLDLAAFIGRRLTGDLKRLPSNYHGEDSALNSSGKREYDCKNCMPVNPELGIIHSGLAVLTQSSCPSVLIEAGNIIDEQDEALINTDSYRNSFAQAVSDGITDYLKAPKAPKTETPASDGDATAAPR